MARRRKAQNDALGAGFLLIVALVVLVFVLRLVATVLFYGLPLALAAAWLATLGARAGPPAIPDARDFDDAAASASMMTLVGQRNELAAVIQQQYVLGDHHAIDLTLASDQTRFDARSRIGKELNRNLDRAEEAFEAVQHQISTLWWEVYREIPDLDGMLTRWVRLKALHNGALVGLVVLVCLSVFSIRFELFPPDSAAKAASILLWDPLPEVRKDQLVLSSALTLLLAGLSTLVFAALVRRDINTSALDAWQNVRAKWTGTDAFEGEPSLEEDEDEGPAAETLTDPSWFNILEVSATAAPADVKAAYRRAMKAYHPDHVANLGPKLQALAEEETKRINNAFLEAKRELGFQ